MEIKIINGWEEKINYRRAGKQWWVLLQDSIIKINTGKEIIHIRIPKGYQWNGASIPKIFKWYTKPENHLFESLFHDWAYQFHWFYKLNMNNFVWEKFSVSKMYSDNLFHDLAKLNDIRITKIDTMWAALAIGGWMAWFNGTCNADCEICPCDAGSWCPESKIERNN